MAPKLGTSDKPGFSWRSLDRYRGLMALAAVIVVWMIYPPRKMGSGAIMWPFDPELLSKIFFERSIYGLLAVGMTLVIIAGGIDLSVGSVLALSAVCFSIFTLHFGWPVWQAIPATIGVGAAAGLMSGLWVVNLRLGLPLTACCMVTAGLITKLGWHIGLAGLVGLAVAVPVYFIHKKMRLSVTMQPFAATLAMMVLARGVAKWVCDNSKVQGEIPEFYDWLRMGSVPPLVFVFLVVVALAFLLLRFTQTGRHIYSIGGYKEAARLSGIKIKVVGAVTYIFCGVTAALAGIGQVARTLQGNPEVAMGYELDAIAAVVIGGTSLMGGRGGVLLTLLGVLIIGFLEKYLSLHGWSDYARLMAKGAIIVVAVAMQKQAK